MDTGYLRFSAAIILTLLLFGSSPAAGGARSEIQSRNPGKSALGKYLSSSSAERRRISGVRAFFDDLTSRTGVSGVSRAGGGAVENGLLGDTLSLLVDRTSQTWFEEGPMWLNESRESHNYNGDGRRMQTTGQFWQMNAWQNTYQINYHYDGIGILRNVVGRTWNGGSWVDNSSDTVYYDEYGHVVQEYVRTYNGSTWQNYERYFIVYDSTGRPEELRREAWTGSAWENVEQYLIFYTGGGLTSEFVYQTWSGFDWMNNLRDTYAYDSTGNLIEEHNQYWASATWNDDTRYLSTYDVDNFLTEVVEQLWISSSWVNESRQNLNNDLDGRPTEILIQYWDGVAWSNDGIQYHTYDGANLVEDYYVTWDGSAWVGIAITSYTWESLITPDETTQKYPVRTDWNLVSVPLQVGDYSKTTLFPSASSSAFYFDAGYFSAPVLENGRGYWLKFDSAQAVTMTGMLRTIDTIDVTAGWNLVGSVGATIPASGVGSIPGGLVISNFFGFNAGYTASGIIEPGKAYWVKVAEAGKLIMNGMGTLPAGAQVLIEPTEERPPSPPEESGVAGAVPVRNSLEQNYPNPFNPVTEIHYSLNEPGHVRLSVYNVIGREVARLVDGTVEAGTHAVTFDGGQYPSGVYFYKMTMDDYSSMRRMILLK